MNQINCRTPRYGQRPARKTFRGTVRLWAVLLLLVSCSVHVQAASDKTLKIALTGKYPPFSFYSNEGLLVGFDVDVSKNIADHMGLEAEIITTEWDGILAGLLAGKYDVIIGSMAITEQRAKAVNFSTPYYRSGAQLFTHQNNVNKINGIDDCKGQRLGVCLGETYEHYLRNNYPEIDVVTYKGTPDIFQDLQNGRLVGFMTDHLVGAWQIKKAGKPFSPVGTLLYEEKIGIPVKKDRPELLKEINATLSHMRNTGELEELHDKWFEIQQPTAQGSQMSQRVIFTHLAHGFMITLTVAATSIIIGFLLAIPGGLLLNRNKGLIYLVIRTFVDFIRGTPVLIQLFFVYFGAPQLGIRLSPLVSAVVTLSINTMAYMSEVVRSGLMSVDPGQVLAGEALGLSRFNIFRLIVWPQAFRIAIPPLMNSVVALTKDTALISIISVSEVIREAQSIISVTFNPIKFYFIVAVMFFAVTFPLMKLAGRLENKLRQKGFAHD